MEYKGQEACGKGLVRWQKRVRKLADILEQTQELFNRIVQGFFVQGAGGFFKLLEMFR